MFSDTCTVVMVTPPGMSMISTSNYVARTYGVRSAMPGFIAKKLCPHLVFIGHESSKYKEASGIVKNIMLEYDPHLASHSLDEFFLDITAYTDKEICRRQQHYKDQQSNDSNNNDRSHSNHSTLAEPKSGPCTSPNILKRKAGDVNFETDLEEEVLEEENEEEEEEEVLRATAQLTAHSSTASIALSTAAHGTNCSLGFDTDGVCVGGGGAIPSAPVSAEYRRRVACEIVEQMRRRVTVATGGLTCSAGEVPGLRSHAVWGGTCPLHFMTPHLTPPVTHQRCTVEWVPSVCLSVYICLSV